jgi:hypothetical protein
MDSAAEAFSTELSTRFTWEAYHFRRLQHDFARYFLNLYDSESVPDQNELLNEAETLWKENSYYEASLRYYFLVMLSPFEPSNYYMLARCLEETGDSYDTLRNYFLYLYFDPDGEWGDANHATEYLNSGVGHIQYTDQ